MKNKLFRTIVTGIVLIAFIGGIGAAWNQRASTTNQQEDQIRSQLVAVSELEQTTTETLDRIMSDNVENLDNTTDVSNPGNITGSQQNELSQLSAQYAEVKEDLQRQNLFLILLVAGISIFVLLAIYLYLSHAIFTPFERMKQYAGEIASGNFDLPLEYDRANYFGDFTWAFDAMRCEISRARTSEQEQIENNKTVIATLTHDIMTPVASIRAYVEGMEASFDQSVEKRMHYLSVLKNKCDEVVQLCDDLFLHSLSDMDKLLVRTQKENLSELLKEQCDELNISTGDVNYNDQTSSGAVYAAIDRKRFQQIIENLVNNARKYAKTAIDITLDQSEDQICVTVRDYGSGIPDQDVPFITHKFYRGSNCGNQKGSGLGLYIVNYLIQQMHGELRFRNRQKGLEIKIFLNLS